VLVAVESRVGLARLALGLSPAPGCPGGDGPPDPGDALVHGWAAAMVAERAGARLLARDARAVHGRALQLLGEEDGARTSLERAHAHAEAIGATLDSSARRRHQRSRAVVELDRWRRSSGRESRR
jgi:hypothetical protein